MHLEKFEFQRALPVWEVGTANEMNRTLCFCADIEKNATSRTVLSLASSGEFVVMVNGAFLAHGPARTAKGFFRVDEYDLTDALTREVNRVTIRVSGYNVHSFEYQLQPSFLCAEIAREGKVLAATGRDGFFTVAVTERAQKVRRYSYQRAFTEAWRLNADSFAYETGRADALPCVKTETVAAGTFLPRDIPYADDEIVRPVALIHRGTVTEGEPEAYYQGREIERELDLLLGYAESEQEVSLRPFERIRYSAPEPVSGSAESVSIAAETYADLAFAYNTTGIFEFDVESDASGILYLLFDEILENGQFKPFRPRGSNIVEILLEKGSYHWIGQIPHTMKYLRLIAKETNVTVRNLQIRHVAFPASQIRVSYAGDDADMKTIFDAAVETFRSNSVDIFTDCPSRERAGWLCDGFFTGRVEKVLSGSSAVERGFLRNFLLPDRFDNLPQGMLPMCYPADQPDGKYIPNWAMWYVLELREYFDRSGDRELVDEAKPKIDALLSFFKQYENEYGLLEKLDSWVFVEWSKANDFVQDVSFPSNMLYAKMLEDCGALYGNAELTKQADRVRAEIRKWARGEDGFYRDHAVRENGVLRVIDEDVTESCQYYAFFCDTATPDADAALWQVLLHSFGYDRAETGAYPNVYPANAFIGNYLRLDLLRRYGQTEELYRDIKGYFLNMAKLTGTLWEHMKPGASCNHGFASHILFWFDALGLLNRTDS